MKILFKWLFLLQQVSKLWLHSFTPLAIAMSIFGIILGFLYHLQCYSLYFWWTTWSPSFMSFANNVLWKSLYVVWINNMLCCSVSLRNSWWWIKLFKVDSLSQQWTTQGEFFIIYCVLYFIFKSIGGSWVDTAWVRPKAK